jgi:hypothetical protein
MQSKATITQTKSMKSMCLCGKKKEAESSSA